jgi:hypothetical protein
MLSSVKYLPSFCGRWEIELYPHWQNLVVKPVPLDALLGPIAQSQARLYAGSGEYLKHSWSFTQLGLPFDMINLCAVTAATVSAVGRANITTLNGQILTCDQGTLTQCLMNQTTFQLRFEVFEGLRTMYSEQPLIIPTNILTYGRFSGQPGGNANGAIFHATLSQSLENVDSIFILVPSSNEQRTCFFNPFLKDLRRSMGEFGTKPQRYVQTWDDARFVAMVLDSLNLETSEITAMNEDVAVALNGYATSHFKVGVNPDTIKWRYHKSDESNFFIGISLSQVGFQSGTVSSPNTNVPFIFDAVLDRPHGGATWYPKDGHPEPELNTSVTVLFLIDAALMIQVIPDSDIPVVKLTSKSIV